MKVTPLKDLLTVAEVQRLERLLGGNPQTEEMVLRFIADKYDAKNLLEVPRHVAQEIFRRPADFVRAAKLHCEPELPF
jgi:hypothetical protein